jgi:hypothetical protein
MPRGDAACGARAAAGATLRAGAGWGGAGATLRTTAGWGGGAVHGRVCACAAHCPVAGRYLLRILPIIDQGWRRFFVREVYDTQKKHT